MVLKWWWCVGSAVHRCRCSTTPLSDVATEGKGAAGVTHTHNPPSGPSHSPCKALVTTAQGTDSHHHNQPPSCPAQVPPPLTASPKHWRSSGGLRSRYLSADRMPAPPSHQEKQVDPLPPSERIQIKIETPRRGKRPVAGEIKPPHRATPKPVEGLCRSRSIVVGSPAHKRIKKVFAGSWLTDGVLHR